MVRKFNFGAGPATLPTSVLEEVRDELLDWKGKGFSVMEISHRSEEYGEIATQAEKDFRDLLNISDSYKKCKNSEENCLSESKKNTYKNHVL